MSGRKVRALGDLIRKEQLLTATVPIYRGRESATETIIIRVPICNYLNIFYEIFICGNKFKNLKNKKKFQISVKNNYKLAHGSKVKRLIKLVVCR